MNKAQAGFDLRIPPQWSVTVLGVSGAALLLHSDTMLDRPAACMHAHILGVALYASTFILWAITARMPRLGFWMTLATATGAAILADHWLDLPEALGLISLTVLLAGAFLSMRAAAVTAAANTAVLTLLPILVPGVGLSPTAIPIYAGWIAFALVVAIYTPVYRILEWAWQNYQESQQNVAEAREHRAELEAALCDLRRANRQLALNTQRMAALRTVADEAQQSKTAFVSRVSHEFRAPLNMIIGLTNLMIERPEIYAEELPPELTKDLDVIHRNTNHLAAMINDVLDLSQTEMGQLTLHPEPVDLRDLVADTARAVSPLIRLKGLVLIEDVPDYLPEVICDRTRIRQVLLNLVSNAARFTEAGTITVRIREKETP